MGIQHLEFPASSADLALSATDSCCAERWKGDGEALTVCGAVGMSAVLLLVTMLASRHFSLFGGIS